MIRAPIAVNTASKAAVNVASRSRIRNLIACAPARLSRSTRMLRACWSTQVALGCCVTPARWTRRLPCSRKNNTNKRPPNTESTWKKSTARMLVAWAVRNCFQVGPVRCGEGSIPAALRILQTVEAATV